MAGLFSKKPKKEKDDTNNRYQDQGQGRLGNGNSGFRAGDNSSANNSTTHSQSDYSHSHSPYPQQQQQQQQHYNNSNNGGLSSTVYSSKSSLQQSSSQQHLHYQGGSGSNIIINNNNNSNNNMHSHSASSFSTHQSNAFTASSGVNTGGPWASGMVMSTNPFPRFAHTASYVTTGTDIYVFGGIVKGSAQKDVHVIDPQSLHCQLLPIGGESPPALTGHSAVTLGQYIMYFGGKDAKGRTSDALYVLHTGRKEWAKPLIQTLQPPPRHSHAACVVGTVMYIVGGKLSGYYMNDIAAFDMKTLNGKRPTWTSLEPKSDLPSARAGHCAAAYDGKIYIFGGADDQYYYNDIWCYDPQTNKWEPIPAYGALPTSRQGHTVCVIDDTMYIFGGMDFEDKLLGDLCAFKFTERRWMAFPNTMEAATPRTEHAMCNVGDKIYILGGQLDLNTTNEDTGIIYVLDTTKIRWNEFSAAGSQRSVYDTDSLVRIEQVPDDNRGSPYSRPTPTPDSMPYQNGMDPNIAHMQDRRATYQSPSQQQQHQQPQSRQQNYSDGRDNREQHSDYHQYQQQSQPQPRHQERQDSYPIESNVPRVGLGIMDDALNPHGSGRPSPSVSPSPMLTPDLGESIHTVRRRTIGKPVNYTVQDVEIQHRGAHSIDEGRRPLPHGSDSGEQVLRGSSMHRQDSSQGQPGYIEAGERTFAHQPEGERSRLHHSSSYNSLIGNSSNNNNDNNNNSGSRLNAPHQQLQQLAHLDLSRHGSNSTLNTNTNTTATDSLQRHGSLADSLNRQGSQIETLSRGSYASISNLQPTARSSVDPSLRVPLRITNPDSEGRDLADQDDSLSVSTTTVGGVSIMNKESRELKDLKQREQWLLAEVSMARKKMGERPLSMAILALEDELDACEIDSEKYRIMQALLNVKAELERSKTSIATQAQIASNKVREAERVRTSALQEAAYLKAKVSALQSGEVSALVATETARATDLERRLATALAQLEQYEAQFVQYETILDHEKESRAAAEAREQEASSRAEEAQLAHTRALNELTTLHERATIAEATLRENAAKSATSEAGLSSYQQQSAALFSQISTLKTTVDHQKKSLEKAKMAYAVANERAEHADTLWTQSREEMDQVQLEISRVRADMDRAQRESEHWRAKAGETELLWQKAKKENEAMRTLLEEDMNAAYNPVSRERKHDSIMAITSASRVAELEHELTSLRQLLRDSQDAATQANRDLGDTMVRISQLEQSSMTARAESATAQRQLKESREQVVMLQAQLIQKEETVEEMIREQENNEVQLGLLRGVMKEHGVLADDLILEALNKSVDGTASSSPSAVSPLKMKIQEAERRATDAETQSKELAEVKKHQEERIQQLEADYQTAVHYVQNTEATLQRLRDEAVVNKKQLEDAHSSHHQSAGGSTEDLEEEVTDLHRQLHDAQERAFGLESKLDSLSNQLQSTESRAEVAQIELQSLKTMQQEHKKRGVTQSDQLQPRVEQLEQTLSETRYRLDKTLEDLEQAHELNKVTGQELEDALDALKRSRQPSALSDRDRERDGRRTMTPTGQTQRRQEELEATIQALKETNQELEEQLKASENKISLLLDNFQGAESVRNSVVSLNGALHGHGQGAEERMRGGLMSPSRRGSEGLGMGKAGGLSNSEKLEEYEKLIEEMTKARRQYEE